MSTYRVTIQYWDRHYGDGHTQFNRSFEARSSAKSDQEAIAILENALKSHPKPQGRIAVAWAERSDRSGPGTLRKYDGSSGHWVRVDPIRPATTQRAAPQRTGFSEHMPKPLTLAMFWFDGGQRVQGWTDGDEWNGWGVPLFDEKQLPGAIRALSAVGFQVKRLGPALRLTHKDDNHSTNYPPETLGGKKLWRIDGLTWNYARGRTPKRPMLKSTRFSLPGWSIGYHDDISAHAAVRDLKSKNRRKRILVMTQDDHEPRDPNEPVDLGLYELDEGESWELVHFEDFDTPADAARAALEDPEWA
jgi:hypothetical protein